jgi:hypothetical protein
MESTTVPYEEIILHFGLNREDFLGHNRKANFKIVSNKDIFRTTAERRLWRCLIPLPRDYGAAVPVPGDVMCLHLSCHTLLSTKSQ